MTPFACALPLLSRSASLTHSPDVGEALKLQLQAIIRDPKLFEQQFPALAASSGEPSLDFQQPIHDFISRIERALADLVTSSSRGATPSELDSLLDILLALQIS